MKSSQVCAASVVPDVQGSLLVVAPSASRKSCESYSMVSHSNRPYLLHTGQHPPFVVVGAVSVAVHMVGKHQTSLQKVLALPPNSPVAPFPPFSTVMAGFT